MEWINGYSMKEWKLFTSMSGQLYYICVNDIISFEFLNNQFQEKVWVKLKINCTHGVVHEIVYENAKKALEAFKEAFKDKNEK